MENKTRKQQMTQQNKNQLAGTDNRMVVTKREEVWERAKGGEGGQIYGIKWKLDFWW